MTPSQPAPAGPRRLPLRRAAAVAAVLVPWLLLLLGPTLLDPVPETVPTHWSGSRPDDLTTTATVWAVTVALASLAAVVAFGALLAGRRLRGAVHRWVAAGAGTVTFGAAAVWWGAVLGTQRAGNPAQVGAQWALVPVLAALAWAAIVHRVHGHEPDPLPEEAREARIAPAPLPPGAARSWSSRVDSTLMLVLAVVLAVTFGLLAVLLGSNGSDPVTASVMGVVGLVSAGAVAALSRLTLTIDDRGLRLRSRVAPVTVKRIRLEEIAALTVAPLSPARWGGIGYRVMPGRSAVVLSGGTGIIVHLVDGTAFAVEVPAGPDAAREGGALLRDLVSDRLHARGSAS